MSPPPCGYRVGRYYDPTTGQFLTVDPLVDQTDAPYAYVAGDPVNEIDPFGLSGCGWNPVCYGGEAVNYGTEAVSYTSSAAGHAVNTALPYVQQGATLVEFGAGVCAVVTSETVIGGLSCGAVAGIAGGVSAGTAIILNQAGRLSNTETVVSVVSAGAGGLSVLARAGETEALGYAGTASVLSWLSAGEAESTPGVLRLEPWLESQHWAGEAEGWTGTAESLGAWSKSLDRASLGIDIGGEGGQALERLISSSPNPSISPIGGHVLGPALVRVGSGF